MGNQNQKGAPSNKGSEGTGEDPHDLQAGSEGESQKWVLWEQFKKEMLEEQSRRRETKQKKFPQGAVSARVLAEAVCGDDTPALPPSFHQDAEACRRSRKASVVRHTRDLEKQTLLPADTRLLIREPGPQTSSPAVGLAEASLMRQLECQRQKHQVALEEALPGSPAVEEAAESVLSFGGCRIARESTVLAGTDTGDLQQSENWGDPSGRSSEQTEQEEQKENLWNQEGPERQAEKHKEEKRAEKTTEENCDKSFRKRAHLIVHERIHKGDRPYKCPHCEKTFTQKIQLTKHETTHTVEESYELANLPLSLVPSPPLTRHSLLPSLPLPALSLSLLPQSLLPSPLLLSPAFPLSPPPTLVPSPPPLSLALPFPHRPSLLPSPSPLLLVRPRPPPNSLLPSPLPHSLFPLLPPPAFHFAVHTRQRPPPPLLHPGGEQGSPATQIPPTPASCGRLASAAVSATWP